MESKKFTESLVSIVTPVYNGEQYISGYFESILNQTYKKLELILVDDGSEDQTVLIAESYRNKLERQGIRVRIIQAEHRNASAALCRGLPYVSGEYLIWPDSDDILMKDSIKIRVDFLRKNPRYSCVRSLSYYFDPVTCERVAADEKRGDLKKEKLFWDILEFKTFVCCGCYMLRSKLFFDIYPDGQIPVYNVGQNFQMLLPYMYRHSCYTIDQELYAVAVRRGSHSRQFLNREQTEQKYAEYEKLVDDIANICNITDKLSLKRIKEWKYRRRLQLAMQYRDIKRFLYAWLLLIRLGEKQMVPILKKMVWMCAKDTKFAHFIYYLHYYWLDVVQQKKKFKVISVLRNCEWEFYKWRKRKKLKKCKPTIIASNCAGTIMYNDLQLLWSSPTVNLSMDMDDFVKFAENLHWYMEQDIKRLEEAEDTYPVGILGDIKLRFVHYASFDEAVEKWELRKKRMNWDNIYIVGCEKDGCTYDVLKRFDELPYKNKVIFTRKKYPEFASAYFISGFEKDEQLGIITFFRHGILKRRYMDDFDYVSFLNGGNQFEKRGHKS